MIEMTWQIRDDMANKTNTFMRIKQRETRQIYIEEVRHVWE